MRIGFHFVEVLIFAIEGCPNNLHLVDGFGGVAEFAWGAEPVGAW